VSAGAAWQNSAENNAVENQTTETGGRSPLAQLLHALNQPLTGLQCSLEVTLSRPRTAAHYAQSLREGLGLTERMRMLVEAIREVAEVEEEPAASSAEAADWNNEVFEAVEDLRPVAEMKNVRIVMEGAAAKVKSGKPARRSHLAEAVFRTLDAALALAEFGSEVRVEAGTTEGVGFRLRWRARRGSPQVTLSRPELGFLIAQARLQRLGAAWRREAREDGEQITVRMPGDAGKSPGG
jgi:hypothetical protein